ncbi:precorrin-2 C(20)-methyltransferase [Bartonella tamiae]|uniref:Precorrin-2 C20-methyltransferase n=1 Tax=Bartonella tamiae Th239 TaxID=1094558 RepID=J0QSI0_9HYPH|nr:precorrin-2 C(20)-methyltransferase [Bartonella tamiae]EJF88826.1 precorrin-2 C20-methyltransferase [Bartonella tamiae Th239]EJF94924.1 precorrin-2 C20-methyltransferase [Bartonella tamiae Th307]
MNNKMVQLYGVGVGPGDPDLITVKGVKAIQSADIIAYHETKTQKSNALNIAKSWITDRAQLAPIRYPVTTEKSSYSNDYKELLNQFYNNTSHYLEGFLKDNKTVVVLAEGDPLFYSSFMYIYDMLGTKYKTEIIPGISSIFGAASIFQTPLAYKNQSFTVLSGVLNQRELSDRLNTTDAFAIIKLGRNLEKVRDAIKECGLIDRALYIERATMKEQKIMILSEVDCSQSPYFSLILIPGSANRSQDYYIVE